MADTTGPGVADDGQSPETLRALRNAAESQTAEDSWPGASAGNNQSVEASGTNQSVEASTEERASLASAAEAEAARATVNAWSANGNQVNARRYSLFTRENQILESIFGTKRGETAAYFTANMIGPADAWATTGEHRMSNGVTVKIVAGVLQFSTDVFMIDPTHTAQRLDIVSNAANAFHVGGDTQGVHLAQAASKIALQWTDDDFNIGRGDQDTIIGGLNILAAKLYPTHAAGIHELLGHACSGMDPWDISTPPGLARVLGGLANKFPGLGILSQNRLVLLMGRVSTISSTSNAALPASITPAVAPEARIGELYKDLAQASDLPSMRDQGIATDVIQSEGEGKFSRQDMEITLTVLAGNGAAAKRVGELLADRINGLCHTSINDTKGVLAKMASGKGEMAGVFKAAELVSGVKMDGPAAIMVLQTFPAVVDGIRGILWGGGVNKGEVTSMLNQFSSDVAGITDPHTTVLLELCLVESILRFDRKRTTGVKGTEVTRLAEAYMGTLKMHAFMGNLPTKVKDLGQKRASTSATTTKKMFTEENCRFCVDCHKGKCGPDEDTDPAGFAKFVCPRGKEHKRVGCTQQHEKGEYCWRGERCHFYHGNGHP